MFPGMLALPQTGTAMAAVSNDLVLRGTRLRPVFMRAEVPLSMAVDLTR